MLVYENRHNTMFSTATDPNCSSAMGAPNLSYKGDFSPTATRKQAFASEGDEIFLPNNNDTNQHLYRYYKSNPFLAAPCAPLENPFSSTPSLATAADIQSSRSGSFLQPMNQGDLKPSSHGSDASSHLSFRPFGNSDTRHSSPCLSVDSTSVLTNHSSQHPNTSLHQQHLHHHHQQQQLQHQQSLLQVPSLPFIPDIKKEPNVSPRKENKPATYILQSQNINSVKLLFSTHLSEADITKNETGNWDVKLNLVMHISSTRNGSVESKTSYIVQRWYTDLRNLHEVLCLSQ